MLPPKSLVAVSHLLFLVPACNGTRKVGTCTLTGSCVLLSAGRGLTGCRCYRRLFDTLQQVRLQPALASEAPSNGPTCQFFLLLHQQHLIHHQMLHIATCMKAFLSGLVPLHLVLVVLI